MSNALDWTAELLYTRWKRAVDILWRESVHRRKKNLERQERARSARRLKNLQRIVRRLSPTITAFRLSASGEAES